MVGDIRASRLARFRAALALVTVIAGSMTLGSPHVRAQENATIEISGFAFSPASVTVTAGATVTWVNNDDVAHTATGDSGEFDTGQFGSGGSASITFDTPGTYAYHCSLHPGMTGTITVLAADDGTNGGTDGGDDGGTTDLPNTGAGFGGHPGGSAIWLLAIVLALSLFAGSARLTLRNRITR